MKPVALGIVLVVASLAWAQDGGVVPAPNIVTGAANVANAPQKAQAEAARTELIRQQTKLLKQQTEALKQQSALAQQQQKIAPLVDATPIVSETPKQVFISPLRKPKADDIDAVTGKPRFATYDEYLDARDEWVIEEAMRRFQALQAK
jgi:hypothetical protein